MTTTPLDQEAQRISDDFEASFLSVPLAQQIANCDHYELAPLFRRVIPDHQPMLEAGCGSGRWVAWAVQQGWASIGIDWSEALCAQARKTIPGGVFHAADMRAMPVEANSIGCILSLGAVEHASEGPAASLREYLRVLRPDGLALITVPYLSPMRRIVRGLKAPLRRVLEAVKGDGASSASRRAVNATTNPRGRSTTCGTERGGVSSNTCSPPRRSSRKSAPPVSSTTTPTPTSTTRASCTPSVPSPVDTTTSPAASASTRSAASFAPFYPPPSPATCSSSSPANRNNSAWFVVPTPS